MEGAADVSDFLEFIRVLICVAVLVCSCSDTFSQLQECNTYPGPCSVFLLDNCMIHKWDEIRQVCQQAGICMEFLLPYSPDLSPVSSLLFE